MAGDQGIAGAAAHDDHREGVAVPIPEKTTLSFPQLSRADVSRRTVLRAAAGAGLAPFVHRSPADAAAANPLDTFAHIVVLMLENRSFDNVLGYLYEPGTVPPGQQFDGVAGKHLSNPIPAGADQADRGTVPVAIGTVPDNPNPDPGEQYPHINTQLYGAFLPPDNRNTDALSMAAPYNLPSPLPAPAPMNGFVTDYIAAYTREKGRAPKYDEYRVIMESIAAENLPSVHTLAKGFAVCDHWHCAVPTQTFCNRSFFHASSSSGAVVNQPYAHWVHANTAPTIFDRIDDTRNPHLTWKIYFDEEDTFPLTALIHYPVLRDRVSTNCFTMAQFLEDARTGKLPSYALIEPRLFINHNDMHPPIEFSGVTQPSSVKAGDVLVAEVYNAIRQAESATGSNWQNTLLLITFDEHGGCYDHVPPPPATPPDPGAPSGQMGCRFDRLGVRVPAILISAYTEAGTVINAPLDHGSVLKTMQTKWGLAGLTARDRASRDISAAFNRTTPRPVSEWPVPVPPKLDAKATNRDQRLNTLQKDILGLVLAITGDSASLKDTLTVAEAVRYIEAKLGRRH